MGKNRLKTGNILHEKGGKKDMPRAPLGRRAKRPIEIKAGQKQYKDIPIGDILDNPYQPRKHFDPKAMEELTGSVKEYGIIQPVLVRIEDEKFYLVAGERRLRAAKNAELATVPAIITDGNPVEISLIENLQRENLNPIEEAEALKRMKDEFGYTQEHLAKVVGKGRTIITETLKLNKLPTQIKEKCQRVDIPKRTLIALARENNPAKQNHLFNIVLNGATSDQIIEQTVKNPRRPKSPSRDQGTLLRERIQNLIMYADKVDPAKLDKKTLAICVTDFRALENCFRKFVDYI